MAKKSRVSNSDIKNAGKLYVIFETSSFRSNIENLDSKLKNNKYVKVIIDFINTDKKRPISLPENLK